MLDAYGSQCDQRLWIRFQTWIFLSSRRLRQLGLLWVLYQVEESYWTRKEGVCIGSHSHTRDCLRCYGVGIQRADLPSLTLLDLNPDISDWQVLHLRDRRADRGRQLVEVVDYCSVGQGSVHGRVAHASQPQEGGLLCRSVWHNFLRLDHDDGWHKA